MPRLLDQVREMIRYRHYSLRTEQVYVHWIREYILFHHKQHPDKLETSHITAFLSHLSVKKNVAASTQNQAASALLFLYREVLGRPIERIGEVKRARTPERWWSSAPGVRRTRGSSWTRSTLSPRSSASFRST